jgi:hypothetical protein
MTFQTFENAAFIAPPKPVTPWQHGTRDMQRTGTSYQAHNTGALVERLKSEYFWEVASVYSRKSHDPARRPFALHAATLRHPDAPKFQILGREWQLAMYVRNAHDSTAAFNSALLLTRFTGHARHQAPSMLAHAPASCRVRHSKSDEYAQALASSAAESIPTATAKLLQWASEPARMGHDAIVAAALSWRFGNDVNGNPFVYRGANVDAMQVRTRLDEYVAAASVAMTGGYYLTVSQRACRPINNVQQREQMMSQAWDWMHQ